MPISSIKESSLDPGLKTNLTNMQDSIGLVQIRQITDGGFAFRGMSAGVSDTFEDISGIDSANTLNLSFQSATDKFTANTFVSGTISTVANTQLGDNSAKTGWAGESGFTFNSPSTNNITSGTSSGGSNQRLNLARQVDITGAFDLYFKLYSTTNGWVGIYRASDESHIDTDNDSANHYTAGMFSSSASHWVNGDPAGTVGYLVFLGNSDSYGYNPKGASSTTVSSTSTSTVHRLSREAGGAIKWYVDGVLKATSTTSTTTAMRVVIGGAGEGSYLYLDYLRLETSSTANVTNISNTTLVTAPTTASEVPTKARVVLIAANNEPFTLNTELIASVSRDNGTTYTATTLSNQGVYANTGNVRIYTGEASLTSQPSGTTIRTKIQTANNKNVEIHAYTTQWRSSV